MCHFQNESIVIRIWPDHRDVYVQGRSYQIGFSDISLDITYKRDFRISHPAVEIESRSWNVYHMSISSLTFINDIYVIDVAEMQ